MIYYYSTLIQFVAAIYVTLSFDTWLFKSLWSMSYAKLINERVETLFKSSSSTIEQHLINNVANNAWNTYARVGIGSLSNPKNGDILINI